MNIVEYKTLTPEEQEAYHLLIEHNPRTLLAPAILKGIQGNAKSFRLLIKEIRSQGEDYPPTMKRIIGVPAWNAVKKATKLAPKETTHY